MKNIRFIPFVLLLGTLLLSACGAGAATPTSAPEGAASVKVDAMPVAFVGIVDRMAGDQWVISGTTVTVDASIVRDGPFNVGDHVKVEGHVNPDGSFTVSRVEAPRPQEIATLPPFTDDNSNDALTNGNTNDANANINDDQISSVNSNDDHGNDANINDDHSNSVNSNDDQSNASNSNDSNINDDSSTVNSNDDNSSASNSNDSNTNNDNGGNTNSNNNHDDSNSNGNGGNDNTSGGGSGNTNSGGDDHGGGNGNDG